MRLLPRSILALLLLAPAAIVPACGSSNGSAPGEGDAGTPPVDGSVPTPDSSIGTPGDSGGADAGPETSVTPADDGGILGANCPAFDAGPGAFVEGPHGPLPTVIYNGGGVLAAPQIITFTFSTTPGAATIQAFDQTITQSPWYAAVTKDYCVQDGGPCIGPGPEGVSIPITAAAASVYVDDFGQAISLGAGQVDLQAFINQQIAAAVTAKTIPAPGPNSLYAFYFPPSSAISMGLPQADGSNESCNAFGGYHSNMAYTDGTTTIVYAIVPDCPTGEGAATDLQYVTLAASHEIIEATTDPNVNISATSLGWYLDQDESADAGPTVPQIRNDPWATAVSFGEVGDDCESIPNDFWFIDSGVQVQRIWSPSAAALGHNPCIPVPTGEAYYNASPDKVLYVADVGSTFTVDLSVFSDMPRSSWRLDAIDGTPTQATTADGGALGYLQMEFVGGVTDSSGVSHALCVNNATTAQLKVTLLSDPTTDTTLQQEEWPEADGVIYSADIANATSIPVPEAGAFVSFPYQFWPFAVVTPATAASLGLTDAGVVDAVKLRALRAAHHAQLPPGARRAEGFARHWNPRMH